MSPNTPKYSVFLMAQCNHAENTQQKPAMEQLHHAKLLLEGIKLCQVASALKFHCLHPHLTRRSLVYFWLSLFASLPENL